MDDTNYRALTAAPKVVERLLRVFPHDRLDDRIDNDRFTAREVVAHLADYEQTVLDRIRAACTSPGRSVPDYDPDQRAQEHHFNDKEVFHEAEVYESRRGMTIQFLQEMQPGDWHKTMKRSSGQEYTVADYVNFVLMHDLDHLEQLSSYLATEAATLT
ncbi:DinB family protein [Kamptonema cortianum]|nr:DinB family protein [Geitlerinema splendidum]MDK3155279.1 DinB family protein [Kamptonema cortianum]